MASSDFSVVLPVYEEEENLEMVLEELTRALDGSGSSYEIVAVDDGSGDGSLEMLRALRVKFPALRVLRLAEHRGQSAALHAGVRAARNPVVITMDSDGQYDPADIIAILDAFERPGVDAVAGMRARRMDSPWKKLQSRIANGVRNRLTDEHIRDTGCALKAVRRVDYLELPAFNGMHRFLPTLLRRNGKTVVEVPVSHRPRGHGRSKYGMWGRLIRGVRDVMGVRWLISRRLSYKLDEVNSDHGTSTAAGS